MNNRRERKKILIKKSISDVALKFFLAKGFTDTTVAEIMEAADLGTGTFYNYFQSKEDVLHSYLTEKINEARHILEAIQQSHGEPSQKLSEILLAAGKSYEENRQLFNMYMQFHRQNPDAGRQPPHGPLFKEILVDIVSEGQEKGEFRKDIPTAIIIEMFMGLLQSTMTSYLPTPFMDNLRHKLSLFLEGLAVKHQP
ncbi:transcriptional regulator, TetR family [Desulfotomaculum arcticum]|uniref:Transcriptional regulator, TetR family n=1 Tax=Desulfotruncus arcticus DSM 17038 TaxID=1121424 RepID=A0A1I2NX58_9FIRM|nr:TetR/AcrR family transcriptional regulator [Desulfotruncus arcticus]SFG08113.1 transcriptional regulator, TetR family [Desulfotomaculum arcticum] [Desulfotruncus arcticus DSM 17038]